MGTRSEAHSTRGKKPNTQKNGAGSKIWDPPVHTGTEGNSVQRREQPEDHKLGRIVGTEHEASTACCKKSWCKVEESRHAWGRLVDRNNWNVVISSHNASRLQYLPNRPRRRIGLGGHLVWEKTRWKRVYKCSKGSFNQTILKETIILWRTRPSNKRRNIN